MNEREDGVSIERLMGSVQAYGDHRYNQGSAAGAAKVVETVVVEMNQKARAIQEAAQILVDDRRLEDPLPPSLYPKYRIVRIDLFANLEAAVRGCEANRGQFRKHLEWIAQQFCTFDAEGASDDTDCTETDACATEYCLSCYARAALRCAAVRESLDVSDEEKEDNKT